MSFRDGATNPVVETGFIEKGARDASKIGHAKETAMVRIEHTASYSITSFFRMAEQKKRRKGLLSSLLDFTQGRRSFFRNIAPHFHVLTYAHIVQVVCGHKQYCQL